MAAVNTMETSCCKSMYWIHHRFWASNNMVTDRFNPLLDFPPPFYRCLFEDKEIGWFYNQTCILLFFSLTWLCVTDSLLYRPVTCKALDRSCSVTSKLIGVAMVTELVARSYLETYSRRHSTKMSTDILYMHWHDIFCVETLAWNLRIRHNPVKCVRILGNKVSW